MDSFSLGRLWLWNFLAQNIGEKAAHKMLMKLTLAYKEVYILNQFCPIR